MVIEILEENSLDDSTEQSLEKSPKRPLEEIPGESKEGQLLEEITEELPVDHITLVEIRQESHEEKIQEKPLEEIPDESQEKTQAEKQNCENYQNQTRAQDMILTPWGITAGCLIGLLAVVWAMFGVYSKEFLVSFIFLLLVFCPGY